MLDISSKEWLAITAELDKIEKSALKSLRMGFKENADQDRAEAWMARGQLYVLEQIRKLPTKEG